MRPRTLRRRGQFYRRRRSRWRLNLALVLIGGALAGFVVMDMRAGAPAPGPGEDTARRIAAPPPATHAPAQTAPAQLGSATLASAASAQISAPPPRAGRPGALANRRDFDSAGARLGVSTVRGVKVTERAPVPRTLAPAVMRSPTPPEGCKTCGDEVPF